MCLCVCWLVAWRRRGYESVAVWSSNTEYAGRIAQQLWELEQQTLSSGIFGLLSAINEDDRGTEDLQVTCLVVSSRNLPNDLFREDVRLFWFTVLGYKVFLVSLTRQSCVARFHVASDPSEGACSLKLLACSCSPQREQAGDFRLRACQAWFSEPSSSLTLCEARCEVMLERRCWCRFKEANRGESCCRLASKC